MLGIANYVGGAGDQTNIGSINEAARAINVGNSDRISSHPKEVCSSLADGGLSHQSGIGPHEIAQCGDFGVRSSTLSERGHRQQSEKQRKMSASHGL